METHEKIRMMRELNKWSQEDMAEKLALSAGGYARIERGETKLNIPRLQELAEIFKVEITDLLPSAKGGFIVQINEGDESGGDITMYGSSDAGEKVKVLQVELKHYKMLLAQKEQENALLREMLALLKKEQA
ncbi:MAG: helix-turn-helix transcriptional regulator [Neisseria animaloris]|nr:helix-turn-helix transcriptional regulator [Neisseria animaloris]